MPPFNRGGGSEVVEESHLKRVTVGNNNGEMDILAGLPGAGPMTHPKPKSSEDQQRFDRKEGNAVPQQAIITQDQYLKAIIGGPSSTRLALLLEIKTMLDPGELVVEQRELTLAEQFAQVVLPIRGFGPRKLTEQELGRWRSLVSRDTKFIELVQSATTVEEIEQVCSRIEYRSIFTPLKWSQIALCIYEAGLCQEPTSNLQSSHSRSQLNVYVGNVGIEW